MTHRKAIDVEETGMHKAFRTVLITPDGEKDVYAFSPGQLDPNKTFLVHTTSGNYNIEINTELGVYMDESPIDWNLPSQN